MSGLDIKNKLVEEHDKVIFIMGSLDVGKSTQLERYKKLSDYKNGLIFALDLLDE